MRTNLLMFDGCTDSFGWFNLSIFFRKFYTEICNLVLIETVE